VVQTTEARGCVVVLVLTSSTRHDDVTDTCRHSYLTERAVGIGYFPFYGCGRSAVGSLCELAGPAT